MPGYDIDVQSCVGIAYNARIIGGSMTKQILSIPSMKCDGCVSAIEYALKSMQAAAQFTVSLENKNAIIEGEAKLDDLIEVIKNAGFDASSQ